MPQNSAESHPAAADYDYDHRCAEHEHEGAVEQGESFGVPNPGVIAMPRIATGRIVGLIIAIVGIGVSIWYACIALRMNAEFYQWLDARPMESVIDLSKPGETTVAFHQTCHISHGEALYLESDLDDESEQDTNRLLKDLSGSIVIKDLDGTDIESVAFNNETVQSWDGTIRIAEFAPFPDGDYVATIRVDSGAAALAGKQQTIYAKYELCGLERMPAMIAAVVALGAGIIGLVAAVCVLPGLLRCGIRRDGQTHNA